MLKNMIVRLLHPNSGIWHPLLSVIVDLRDNAADIYYTRNSLMQHPSVYGYVPTRTVFTHPFELA